MNKIVHETNNNMVLDVEENIDLSKKYFEELLHSFSNNKLIQFNSISKGVSEFKLNRDQWKELIISINPFNNNVELGMAKIQKDAFPFYNFIIKNMSLEDLEFLCENCIDIESKASLMNMISVINNGYKLLYLIESRLSKDKLIWINHAVSSPLIDAARYGNLKNYLYFDNLIDYDYIDNYINVNNTHLFVSVCNNPDMRIMKHFLNKYKNDFKLDNNYLRIKYFSSILSNHIPFKYQMRRMKLLNSYFKLCDYFDEMLFSTSISYKAFKTLSKYYYLNPLSINDNNSFFNNLKFKINDFFEEEGDNIFSEIFDIFNKFPSDIKRFYESIVYFNTCLDNNITNGFINEVNKRSYNSTLNINFMLNQTSIKTKIINYITKLSRGCDSFNGEFCYSCNKNSIICILNSLSKLQENPIFYNSESCYFLLKQGINQNIHFNGYIGFITRLILMMKVPFEIPKFSSNIEKSIMIALRIRSLFKRVLLRKVTNLRKKQKINFKIVLNNIITFKPNYNIPVLSKGSYMYRMNLQKLEKHKYPVHIDPCQMIWLGKKDCLIREKADGIYTDAIPFKHYPHNNIFSKHVIKSEFLEDDNLNLIFDIDMNDYNIIERYQELRKAHPFTKDHSEVIVLENVNHFVEEVEKERKIYQKFKQHVEDNNIFDPLWYPKAAWFVKGKIDSKGTIISELTKIVTELNNSDEYDTLINKSEFLIDGYIVQPISGNTEAKIKPHDQMTADLLFDGSKWLTRERKHIKNVKADNIRLSKNIWRCYWKDNNWIPREIRWDKKIPNPNFIVDYLTKYNSNKWLVNDILKYESSYYNESNKIDYKLQKIFQKQRNIQLEIFKFNQCHKNSKWLDIGCGKGNSIKNINYFNPAEYVGFDNDPNCVWEAKLRHESEYHNFTFFDFNLEDKYHNLVSTDKINNVFDYLVLNFVIHYAAKSKEVWNNWLNQINLRSKSGSVLFVNFMNYDKLKNITKDDKFELNDTSYIELIENKEFDQSLNQKWAKIKFDWVHSDPILEPVLTNDFIVDQFYQYGWKLTNNYNLDEDNSTNDKFCSIYSWLTLTKI